ncbi:hypothetical protein U0355_01505 [Salimicrobium sp. PL1-032A]|uniref:hypothetical protein n=1 Tax=Salimicrobium sp. PL1-032A TaxID=3095364 RepID=UPI0032611E92
MKKHWILPLIVVTIGIFLLVIQNYKESTTPPSESWSREVDIATTTVRSGVDAIQKKDATYTVAYFSEDALVERTYDKNLEATGKVETPLADGTGADVFTGEERTIYFSDDGIYEAGTEEAIADARLFRPLEEGVLYVSDAELFYMDGASLETMKIAENITEDASIHAYETKEELIVSVSTAEDNHVSSVLYRYQEGDVSTFEEIRVELSPSLKMDEVYPLLGDNKPELLISAVPAFQRSSSGKKDFYTTTADGDDHTLSALSFPDPETGASLEEIEDLQVTAEESAILFRAQGFTETKTGGSEAFNVYEGRVEEGKVIATRRSNTPRLSVAPASVSGEVVAWLDIGADQNTVFLSAATDHEGFPSASLTEDTALRTAGKTMMMLSTGLMTIVLTIMWYSPPLLLMSAWTFRRRNPFDDEKEWSFYGTIALYTAVALLFHHHLFKAQVVEALPSFLGFPGSPFVVILVFSLVALAIVKVSDLDKWWGIPGRISYFIGLHILFMTVFIGPYLY